MQTVRSGCFLCLLVWLAVSPVLAQWVQTSVPLTTVTGIVASGTKLFAAARNVGAFQSIDEGVTWQPRNTNFVPSISFPDGIAMYGDTLYAFGGLLQKMSTNDTIWSSPLTLNPRSPALYAAGPVLVTGFGQFNPGMARSTDYGDTWTFSSYPPVSGIGRIMAFGTSGSALLAGANDTVYRSIDVGATWTGIYVGLASAGVVSFHDHSTGLYAGGVVLLRSTNNGGSWTLVTTSGLLTGTISSIASFNQTLFCTVIGRGVYFSTNAGANWTAANTGLTSPNQASIIIIKGSNAFLGTSGSGVWKRPVSQFTSVEPIPGDVPISFALVQNYPNPFNPSTTIGFSLPAGQAGILGSGFTTLKVFDLMGGEVATLVNEELKAGTYETTWNPSGLASGIYFCRLQAGTFSATKKLMLLR